MPDCDGNARGNYAARSNVIIARTEAAKGPDSCGVCGSLLGLPALARARKPAECPAGRVHGRGVPEESPDRRGVGAPGGPDGDVPLTSVMWSPWAPGAADRMFSGRQNGRDIVRE